MATMIGVIPPAPVLRQNAAEPACRAMARIAWAQVVRRASLARLQPPEPLLLRDLLRSSSGGRVNACCLARNPLCAACF
jgi:hypothetical protein